MNLNLTLVVQMIVFAILIWFTMRFVWPLILGAMDERAKTIADGLAAAEKGQQDLAQAETRAEEIVREARARATQIVDQASHRANEIVEGAKQTATTEGARIVATARSEAGTEFTRARDQLRRDVGNLAVLGASRLLGREVDAKSHAKLLDELAEEIARG